VNAASCERKIANLLWSSQRVGLAVEAAEALHLLPDCDSFRLTLVVRSSRALGHAA
jgi:hypothetical protein